MYKLTIVAGPNLGTSYVVQNNETTIGRVPGNVIVLESQKVSKKHCRLSLAGDDVVLHDDGSANGTFVNGVLTRERRILPGDRISVGEYVLELVRPRNHHPIDFQNNVLAFPQRNSETPLALGLHGQLGSADYRDDHTSQPIPADVKGKVLYYFDQYVMPFFYDMNFRNEWRVLVVGLFGAFILANLLISVSPLLKSSRRAAIAEVAKRAQVMARAIAEHNTPALASRAEIKTEIGGFETAEGVRLAMLTDLENRILAPSSKFNQYLLLGGEAKFAAKMAGLFRNGRLTGSWSEVDQETVTAVEPVTVASVQLGKNVVVGMAIVSVDSSLATPSTGEMGIAYSETLIMTGVLAIAILFVLMRLTLKPFQVLNDDIDKVLKGEMGQVTHEFKFSELNQLWDVINAALARATRSDASAVGGANAVSLIEEISSPLLGLGAIIPFGFGLCDGEQKITYLNPVLEEITGIRNDSAIGQQLTSVARDQAFGALCSELFEKATPGSEGVSEDFEFSGVSYKVHVAAFGSSLAGAKGFFITAVRSEQ